MTKDFNKKINKKLLPFFQINIKILHKIYFIPKGLQKVKQHFTSLGLNCTKHESCNDGTQYGSL